MTAPELGSSIVVPPHRAIERVLSLEIVRVTERAAVAAAHYIGQGNEISADHAAVDAMRRELNALTIDGVVVVSEGERKKSPSLRSGEIVGRGEGIKVDIAADPLEGKNLCAESMPGAISAMAIAERGGLLNAPDVYMEKVAIGPGYPDGIIDLDALPEENIEALAKAKNVGAQQITVTILNRPRHRDLIASVRKTGAAVRLIPDGDLIGVIHTADPAGTGVDIYLGVGGATEGILAAAALRCIGGQFQGRLIINDDESSKLVSAAGINDPTKKYTIREMVKGDCLFAATGVTDGSMLRGVRFLTWSIETESVVMHSQTGTVRWIRAEHRDLRKFQRASEL